MPPLRVLRKSEGSNVELKPFEPVLNPIIAQMFRAIFKGEKSSKIYIKVM